MKPSPPPPRSRPWTALILLATLAPPAAGWSPESQSTPAGGGGGRNFREAYRSSPGFPHQASVAVDLPMEITVGLMTGQKEVSFRTEAPARLECGPETLRSRPGQKWRIVLVRGRAARTEAMPLLTRIPADRSGEALRLEQAWEARGHRVTLYPMGVLLTERRTGKVLNDSRCLYLTLPPEPTWTAAWNRCIELTRDGANPTVYERLVEPAAGVLALVDAGGRVRARGPDLKIRSGGLVTVYRVEHDQNLPQHGFATRRYRSPIDVHVGRLGKLTVTTAVELEDYLKGVVPSEIYASDPPAALRAQAVAARTETLANLGFTNAADPFDICSDQHCQAYKGVDYRSASTDRAVEDTRGEVLRFGSTLLNAVYSDTCGGHTENLEKVWSLPPHPAMKGRPDLPDGDAAGLDLDVSEGALRRFVESSPPAWCSRGKDGRSGNFRWRASRSVAELSRSVNGRYRVGRVEALVPLERGRSGRLRRLMVVGSEGKAIIFKELAIRQALGGLKSGMFVIDTRKDAGGRAIRFDFTGGGWGHGVGMCQSGSRGRALAGQSHRDILGHYYRGAEITRLY